MGAANPPVSVLDPRLARQVAAMLETVTGPEGGLVGEVPFQSHNQKVVANDNGIFVTHAEGILQRSTDGGRAWVYGRVGQPCHRCGTTIRMRRQGDAGRSTYFCPRCQPEDSGAS